MHGKDPTLGWTKRVVQEALKSYVTAQPLPNAQWWGAPQPHGGAHVVERWARLLSGNFALPSRSGSINRRDENKLFSYPPV